MQFGRFATSSPDPVIYNLPLPLFYVQALSKRIHYGKFVAEAKFLEAPDVYKPAIRAQVGSFILPLLP